MKTTVILFCVIFAAGFWLFTDLLSAIPTNTQVTPNANLALEARVTVLEGQVTVLEGQVKELRRVVGIEGGLKEGLQNKKAAPVSPKK